MKDELLHYQEPNRPLSERILTAILNQRGFSCFRLHHHYNEKCIENSTEELQRFWNKSKE